jgi:hydrogenase-4 membrane subunit HyfE
LVWRRYPQYLVFPAAQYALSTALGYGFPSEILLAPGFLWIALFVIVTKRAPSILFLAVFIGLVFSHELAVPAAIVGGALAVQQACQQDRGSGTRWRAIATFGAVLGAFALLVLVRLSGGGTGSDANAIFVVDPRRIFNNPSMWVLVLAVIAAITACRYRTFVPSRWGAPLLIVGTFVVPLLLKVVFPGIDFEQGRYDSARSIVGVMMLFLALCFVLVLRVKPEWTRAPADGRVRHIPFVLSVALAASVGSALAFLHDWDVALRGLERVIRPTSADGWPEIISYEQALGLMQPEEALANDRIDFQWVMPYRSILLADGGVPARVVVIDGDYRAYCAMADRIDPSHSTIPLPALTAMREFSCTHVPPPPLNTLSRRLFRYLSNLKDQIFGEKAPSR